MENASKALYIAGVSMLMVLLLALAMYIFRTVGTQTSVLYKELKESEITEFNQKFINFETRPDTSIDIYDVVSIVNLAKDNNELGGLPAGSDSVESGKLPVHVTVILNNEQIEGKSQKYLEELIKTENENTKYENNEIIRTKYSCAVEYSKNLHLIEKVIINSK